MQTGRVASGCVAALVLMLVWTIVGRPALAQEAAELQRLGSGNSGHVERYQVTLQAGGSLWRVGTRSLPLVALDEGDDHAYQLVLESFQHDFPDRRPDALQPGDQFVLEVPAGTFVTEQLTHEGTSLVYRSFQGDQLTVPTREPAVLYRLVQHDHPKQAEVRLTGRGSPVELARQVYEVDPPDFIQVRMVRAALGDAHVRVVVNLEHPYLDEFRNYRERAARMEPGDNGLAVYDFPADALDIPFARVEDGVGDETDPGAFPRLLRLAFYRAGMVRKYLVTESGDSLSTLSQPETARWRTILPSVTSWRLGTVEPLPPFAPPLNEGGALLPDRLLVLRFDRELDAQTAGPPAGSGLTCAGLPLALVLGAWALRLRRVAPLA